jgi:uncharacterized protein
LPDLAPTRLTDGAVDAVRNAGHFAHDLIAPTVRLGVTGLARAGKTVFITALIHNLLASGRLPFFDAAAQGRLLRAYLEPQPDDQVPRFDYERHLADLTGAEPIWPESTRRISQVRIALEYEPNRFWKRRLGRRRLHIDIVDFPGEWLLDLPLLRLDYRSWSEQALSLSKAPMRSAITKDWHAALASVDPAAPATEADAAKLADAFKHYLTQSREDPFALSTVPPGRFLMPGELEGSPALTFAPLAAEGRRSFPRGSLWSMMERRFEAYKTHVVRPFFRGHFARLDRQIVLVDALAALHQGPEAVSDLERAMADILACFRTGSNRWWSSLFSPRIDRIVFAATKADHLHQTSHDRLEAVLAALTAKAIERAELCGADVRVLAMAAVRATREGEARHGADMLPCIVGRPMPGEKIGGNAFDGKEEFAVFPGDLPDDPKQALLGAGQAFQDLNIVRFRPPAAKRLPGGNPAPLPNIRLDRALQVLIGDRLA